jgi:hypothetical protein
MTLHDDLLGDLYSAAAPAAVSVEQEDAPEEAAPGLLDSFTAGCRQTWADVRAWVAHPRDALAELKHWEPPSAAAHDIYAGSVTGDRFEELHQRWIGRGGVRLGVAWIALVSRGRRFGPAFLATAAAIALPVLLATH